MNVVKRYRCHHLLVYLALSLLGYDPGTSFQMFAAFAPDAFSVPSSNVGTMNVVYNLVLVVMEPEKGGEGGGEQNLCKITIVVIPLYRI